MLPLEGAEPPDLGDKGPERAWVGGEEAGKMEKDKTIKKEYFISV